jgi:hypothetical protein
MVDPMISGVKFIRVLTDLASTGRIVVEVMFDTGLRVCVEANEGDSVDDMPKKLINQVRSCRPDSHRDYVESVASVGLVTRWIFRNSRTVNLSGVRNNASEAWTMAAFRASIDGIGLTPDRAMELIEQELPPVDPFVGSG